MARQRRTPIPNRIGELRRAARLSQDALATKVGLVQSQVGKIERGEHALQDYLLERFAAVFGVKPWEITNVGPQRRRLLLEIFDALSTDKQNTLLTLARALADEKSPSGDEAEDPATPTPRRDRAA